MRKQIVQKNVFKPVLYLLVVVLTLLAVGSPASAQLPPPISPWMGMFDRNRNPSSISNYHQYVKPQQDMMRAYAAQASQLQNQQQALQALQSSGGLGGDSGGARDMTGASISPSGGGSDGRNMLLSAPREIPSTQRNPAGFNQYLHYYPSGSLPRQPVPNFSTTGRRR